MNESRATDRNERTDRRKYAEIAAGVLIPLVGASAAAGFGLAYPAVTWTLADVAMWAVPLAFIALFVYWSSAGGIPMHFRGGGGWR